MYQRIARTIKTMIPVMVMSVCMLTGCSQQNTDVSTPNYKVKIKGIELTINMDIDPVLDTLGDPVSTFTAPTCAFEGEDVLYTYDHAEIDVFRTDDGGKLYSVDLLDDLIETEEGVCLGDSVSKVIDVYGEGSGALGERIYPGDGMELRFIFRDGCVAAIRYVSTTLENELIQGSGTSGKDQGSVRTDTVTEKQDFEETEKKEEQSVEVTLEEEGQTAEETEEKEGQVAVATEAAYIEENENAGAVETETTGVTQAGDDTDDEDDGEWHLLSELDDMETIDRSGWSDLGADDLRVREQLLNDLKLKPKKPSGSELTGLLNDIMPQVLEGCTTTAEEVRSAYDYLIDNCSYSTTVKYDYETDASILLSTGRGSCTYYVAALHYMLLYIGVDNRIVNGYRYPHGDRDKSSFHRWIEIDLDGTSYILDAQWEDVLKTESGSGYERYLRTHDEMYNCYAF